MKDNLPTKKFIFLFVFGLLAIGKSVGQGIYKPSSYSYSVSPNGSYGDSGGELNNGLAPSCAWPSSCTFSQYVGWNNTNGDFTLNFPEEVRIYGVRIQFADSDGEAGVGMPSSVTLDYAGGQATTVSTANPGGTGVRWVEYLFPESTAYTNDKIRVRLNRAYQWTMVAEVEVIAAPKNARVQEVTDSTFTIAWDQSTSADSFLLYVSSNNSLGSAIDGYNPKVIAGSATEEVVALGDAAGVYQWSLVAVNTQYKNSIRLAFNDAAVFKPGNGLAFDGVNDYIAFLGNEYNFYGTNPFTVEAWVKRRAGDGGYIMSEFKSGVDARFLWQVLDDGRVRLFRYNNGQIYSSNSIPADRWVHLAGTYDGSRLKLYIDGELEGDVAAGAIGSEYSQVLLLGLVSNDGTNRWSGSMDEVRIWDQALSQAELQSVMFSETPAVSGKTLLHHYDFDASYGTTLEDKAGSADGLLYNFALTGETSNWVESYAQVVPRNPETRDITDNGFEVRWNSPETGYYERYVLDIATTSDFAAGSFLSGYEGKELSRMDTVEQVVVSTVGKVYFWRVRAQRASTLGEEGYTPTQVVAKAPGLALDFDGVNDYVDLPDGVYFDDASYTIETWAYLKSYTSFSRILDFGNGPSSDNILIAPYVDGKIRWYVFEGSTSSYFNSKYEIPLNRWVHLAFVQNGSNAYIYMDGVEVGFTSNMRVPRNVTRTNNYLAKSNWSGDPYLNVRMDEFRIWNTARTQEQLRANMYREYEAGSVPAELIAYYQFTDGVGLNLTDKSGNGKNGQLVNMDNSDWVESYAMVGATNLEATDIQENGFTLNWTAPETGYWDKYYLDVSYHPDFAAGHFLTGYEGKEINRLATSEVVSVTAPRMNYYWRLRAEKEENVSGQGANVIPDTVWAIPPGNGLAFDGVNDYVDLGSAIYTGSSVSEFTVEMWVRLDDLPENNTWHFLIGSDESGSRRPFNLYSYNKTIHYSSTSQGGGYTGEVLHEGVWQHIAWINSGNQNTIYVNGQAVEEWTSGSSTTSLFDNIRLGGYKSFSKMVMDEVRFWDRALSREELLAGMFEPVDQQSMGLEAYYRFDEGNRGQDNSGVNQLVDVTGHGHHGSLVNFALTGDASNWVESYAMVAPNNTRLAGQTDSTFTVAWDVPKVGQYEKYYLYVSKDEQLDGNYLAGYGPKELSVDVMEEEVNPGTGGIYYWRIVADSTGVVSGTGGWQANEMIVFKPGNGLAFDGVNDFVNLGNGYNFYGSNPFTVEAWVKRRAGDGGFIMSEYNSGFDARFSWRVNNLGRVQIWRYNNGMIWSSNSIPEDRWVHLAGTYDGSRLKLYINGQLEGDVAAGAIGGVWGHRLTLGLRDNFGDDRWSGSMDEVRIWDQALSQAELRSVMFSEAPAVSGKTLLHHYDFDASYGTVLEDKVGSADGSLGNFSLTGETSNWVESYAQVVPRNPETKNITDDGFEVRWNSPETGYYERYVLDIATTSDFAAGSFLSEYEGKELSRMDTVEQVVVSTVGRVYFWRVRAQRASTLGEEGYTPTQVVAEVVPVVLVVILQTLSLQQLVRVE